MSHSRWKIGTLYLVLLVAGIALSAAPSLGADYNLRAEATVINYAGQNVPMWGFALDGGPVTVPGPPLTVLPGDPVLNIHLTNNLSVPVSIVIPGQDAALSPTEFLDSQGRLRVFSFTTETPPGGTVTYTWSNPEPGTFLYKSGTHPAVQVQMGLYGGVRVDAGPGMAYPGVPYTTEVVLLYSEVDPALHNAVATGNYGPGMAVSSTIDYKPAYFLVNGEPYSGQPASFAGYTNQPVLLRFLNAGLKTHVPALNGSYMNVIAEDGNLYPYPREQYSVLLPAGKTADAVWTPTSADTYAVFDRSHHLTTDGTFGGGMLSRLLVSDMAGTPAATGDAYALAEDNILAVAAPGVLGNDAPAVGVTAHLVSSVANGTLALAADGSFSYEPAPDFNGTDGFTYRSFDGSLYSNIAQVDITVNPVNDPPVAVDDAYAAVEGTDLVVGAPGVLGNDGDADGDPLSAILDIPTTNGTLVLNADGSFTYSPNAGTTTDAFSYTVNDGTVNGNTATVIIAVNPAVNQLPIAVDDFTDTQKNTAVIIDVVANDFDPDGSVDPASVVITVPATKGSTLTVNGDGTVTFDPKKNFRGTDLFRYTVNDLEGATSNEATVRVNVQ